MSIRATQLPYTHICINEIEIKNVGLPDGDAEVLDARGLEVLQVLLRHLMKGHHSNRVSTANRRLAMGEKLEYGLRDVV